MRIGGKWSTVVGGDREGNGTGNLEVVLGAVEVSLVGVNPTEVGDNSAADAKDITTRRLERQVGVQGTWTPTLQGSSVAGSNTYGVQVGSWFREGDYLMIQCSITLTATDGAMAGSLRIGGLPFSIPSAITAGIHAISIARYGRFTLTANYTQLTLQLGTNKTFMEFVENANNGLPELDLNVSAISNLSRVIFSGRFPIGVFS